MKNDLDEVSLVLMSDSSTDAAVLTLRFGEIQRDVVAVKIGLKCGSQDYFSNRSVYAWDIQAFIAQLRELQRELAGSAYFNDWDGQTILCFSVAKKWRGLIVVGGKLDPIGFDCDCVSECQFNSPDFLDRLGGIRVSFDGYQTDQSMLPRLANSLRDYLDQSGLEVINPNDF